MYVNPRAARGSAAEEGGLAGLLTGGAANVSVTARSGALALDLDTLNGAGARTGLASADPQAAQALEQLPGESWLAIGLGHPGTHLSSDVAALSALGSLLGGSEAGGGTLSLGSVLSGLTEPLQILATPGAGAARMFRSWMGPTGIFASGASVLELRGAVVIESEDAARSQAAVAALGARLRGRGVSVSSASIPGTQAALAARLPGIPLDLVIAAGTGADGKPRFVLGLGEPSVQAALAPTGTMASSSARSAAASALGEGIEPSLIVQVPDMLALLEGIGLTESPSLSPLLPYLRATTTVSGGGKQLEGGVERFRLVVGLRGG